MGGLLYFSDGGVHRYTVEIKLLSTKVCLFGCIVYCNCICFSLDKRWTECCSHDGERERRLQEDADANATAPDHHW